MTLPESDPPPPVAVPQASPAAFPVGWGGGLLAVLALVIGLAAGAWATNYWLGERIRAASQATLQTAQSNLERLRIELASAQARADALEGQRVVDRSTIQGLETALQKAQADLGLERDKVAFYEQLLPPGPKGAVAVRALEIEQQGPILHYRAVLMRNAQQQQVFTGRLQFIAKGSRQGKKEQLELVPARGAVVAQSSESSNDTADAEGVLALSFEQFQRSYGLLQLPEGFLPTEITMNVLEGDTLRASRSVKLGKDVSD